MVPLISILFAFGLPAIGLWKYGQGRTLKYPHLFSIGSFVFCASGLLAEIITIKRRLFAGDIGGIEDTINAVILICVVLLTITTILNLLLLGLANEHKA